MSSIDVGAIVGAVVSVLRAHTLRLPMHAPDIAADDVDRVGACVARDPVGYSYVNDLETELARVCMRRSAIALSSGTAALHLAMLAVGVKPGDEVIIPAMTFIAAANAVTYCGAWPVIADVPHDRLGGAYASGSIDGYLSVSILRDGGRYSRSSGRRIAAIVVVDLLGVPCDLAKVAALAKAYGVPLIEDAAEALGSRTADGRPCGSFGDVSILSFNNNKIVTSGGGGALLTDDPAIAERVRYLASTAKIDRPGFYSHDGIGFNYRMPNVCAALALGQLGRLPSLLDRKRNLAARYDAAIGGTEARLIQMPAGANRWLNAIYVPPGSRDAIMEALARAGIPSRALFTPIHKQAPYADADVIGYGGTAETLFERTVCLPSGPNL